jgi:hypothetical protein
MEKIAGQKTVTGHKTGRGWSYSVTLKINGDTAVVETWGCAVNVPSGYFTKRFEFKNCTPEELAALEWAVTERPRFFEFWGDASIFQDRLERERPHLIENRELYTRVRRCPETVMTFREWLKK